MSIRSESVIRTQREVLESIANSKSGLTRADLVEAFGFSYSTADNYTSALYKEGKIDMAPTKNGKSILWVVKDPMTIPKIAGDTIWGYFSRFGKVAEGACPERYLGIHNVTRGYLKCLANLFEAAYNMGEGVKVTENDLLTIRNKFITNREALQILIEAHDEIINNALLVDPAKFRDVLLKDENHPVPIEELRVHLSRIFQRIAIAIEKKAF